MGSGKMLHRLMLLAFFLFVFQGVGILVRTLRLDGLCNNGGPLGLFFPSLPWIGVVSVFLVGLVIMWWHTLGEATWAWVVLFAAGLSNFLERVVYGCVFDFLSIPGVSYGPVFNVADMALVLSVVFLVWSGFRKE